MGKPEPAPDPAAPPPSRLKRILKRLWWFHSFFALFFGVGVMLFARAGLAHADKVMMALFISWTLLFIALRFIVGPTNRKEQETFARKGMRVATNYIIKQFYQQMFFFLTPLYASSATWALSSWNWWLAPVLLICAVVSTMDLVFDHFIMERRWLASGMYGIAMFSLLNVLLPLVAGVDHQTGLVVAAAATPMSVALLTFSIKQVLSPQGAILTVGSTIGLLALVWYGRAFIPPAPLAMPEIAVGHGTMGSYECMPGSKHEMRSNQLDGLRCGSLLREPGGLKENVLHVWTHRGNELSRITPTQIRCDGDGVVFRSELPLSVIPKDPTGKWACTTYTLGGQLVGIRKFEVLTSTGESVSEQPEKPGSGSGSGGSGSAGSGSSGRGSGGSGSSATGSAGSGSAGR
ncbi:MAG: hypothetical protein H0T46_32795 [Deltaproteobacteria bacterium]|nr:hypothetical protein [Deltaproteobacteria bacterium]